MHLVSGSRAARDDCRADMRGCCSSEGTTVFQRVGMDTVSLSGVCMSVKHISAKQADADKPSS